MTLLLERTLRLLQRRLLALLVTTYALAAVLPGPGLRLRTLSAGSVRWLDGGAVTLSAPMLLLALLLFCAGLSTRTDELRELVRRPRLLALGLALNTVVPLVYVGLVALALGRWHEPDEAQSILLGLALIGAMPIAGSSTAWSHNAEGNLALSVGLVLGSTVLSPVVTPLALHAVGALAQGRYAADLHALAARGSSGFVTLSVALPVLAGIATRAALGAKRLHRALPAVRATSLATLLLLNYANAAVALPDILRRPDWDFLALAAAVTTALCALAFAAGWVLPRRLAASRGEQVALMFGLGMNNNGTGLVLASAALTQHPLVLLPIVFYNLAQQIVAGVIDARLARARAAAAATTAATAQG